jgi:Spy/CpxP family protein refolding chaperone
MTKRTFAFAVAAMLSVVASEALAQRQPPQPEQPDQDFAQHLFPPELIMQFQQKIQLQVQQRTAITQAIQQMQSKMVDLQWQMQAEVQKLTEIMQATTIKEADALAQVDRVLGMERDVKRAHLGGLIRIKNSLSPEQQSKLIALRDGVAVDSGTIRFRVDPADAEVRVGTRLLGSGTGQAKLPVGRHIIRIIGPGTECAAKSIPVMIEKDEVAILVPPMTKLTCQESERR